MPGSFQHACKNLVGKISTIDIGTKYCVEICLSEDKKLFLFQTEMTTDKNSICIIEFSGKKRGWESLSEKFLLGNKKGL